MFCLLSLLLLNLEVLELIGVLLVGDHAKVISKTTLLQVLLRQILHISLREGLHGGDLKLRLVGRKRNRVAELTSAPTNLNAVMQESLLNKA